MNIKLIVAIVFISVSGRCFAETGYLSEIKIVPLLKTSTDVGGHPLEYPKTGTPEVTGVLVEIPVGQNTGWHFHANPSVEYVLQGQITVEDSAGTKRLFKAGDSFAELVNVKHCGYNTGDVPVKIIMFAIGQVGSPISQKE